MVNGGFLLTIENIQLIRDYWCLLANPRAIHVLATKKFGFCLRYIDLYNETWDTT